MDSRAHLHGEGLGSYRFPYRAGDDGEGALLPVLLIVLAGLLLYSLGILP